MESFNTAVSSSQKCLMQVFFLLQGRVLAGVGRLLRIYDLGKKKLLRKCENKVRISSVKPLPSI